jgi:8-oxo-dGTP diphosphatase
MKLYVAGFLFDQTMEKIALIEKQRPEWQRWQLNGIGGKIERNRQNCMCYENDSDQTNFDPCICPWETPIEAQRREFREETGVDVDNWKEFCLLKGTGWAVDFLYGFDDKVFKVSSLTDEVVDIYDVEKILDPRITHPVIPNLRWLIPMAMTMVYTPGITKYHVTEESVNV